MNDTEDYDVYDENGIFIGSVELVENASAENMPKELEINGVIYVAQF